MFDVNYMHYSSLDDGNLIYVKYVETADLDKREWRKTSGDQPDPINEHFNVFGSLCAQ